MLLASIVPALAALLPTKTGADADFLMSARTVTVQRLSTLAQFVARARLTPAP